MSNPTKAQMDYLIAAQRALLFAIDEPGRRSTGEACERRGWIGRWWLPWVYGLTPAGHAAIEGGRGAP